MELNPVKLNFVLGIGRSGTTMLARLLALSTTPMRYISEPFYGLANQVSPNRIDTAFVAPREENRIKKLRDAISQMINDKNIFKPSKLFKIERDDNNATCLLVKEVHALFAFPEILNDIDCRIIIITRDTSRVLDSYLMSYKQGNYRYLAEEYLYLTKYVRGSINPPYTLIDAALEKVSPFLVDYLHRPKLLTSIVRRTVCTMEVTRQFLLAWAEKDERALHVAYEDLCRNPDTVGCEAFSFLGLDFNDITRNQIENMTRGSSTEYYATDKDSKAILDRPYRKLSRADLRWISNLLLDRSMPEKGRPCA